MGVSFSDAFLGAVGDYLLASTHGFEYKQSIIVWPWSVHNAALRVAYMVLSASSTHYKMRWDHGACGVRLELAPGSTDDTIKKDVTDVVRGSLPVTTTWEMQYMVGVEIARLHRDMHRAIQLEMEKLGLGVPLLIPSAMETLVQLTKSVSRLACEETLVRVMSGQGWLDEMTDPTFQHKIHYERGSYPSRALLLRELIPHLHNELKLAGCARRGLEVARVVQGVAEAQKGLSAALVMYVVSAVRIGDGSDPSGASVTLKPDGADDLVPSNKSKALESLSALVADSMHDAYETRSRAYLGGMAYAKELAQRIVDSVYASRTVRNSSV